MKMAPIIESLKNNSEKVIVVHTGQHYDNNMSQNILDDLEMDDPDYHLGIMQGSHAQQTAKIMINFENICNEILPKLVIVAGDVNSTLACALVAAKLQIKVAHVESGLRSFDMSMPEEINRKATDHISDILFTTEKSANANLKKEGIDDYRVHFVGNCMIDSLLKFIPVAKKLAPWKEYGFLGQDYILVTLHRPSNVDNLDDLAKFINMMNQISKNIGILFPAHPRTKKNINSFGLHLSKSINIIDPLPYIEFLGLLSNARIVLTDSGGIQEETTTLKIPCVTLRNNTERPITVDEGTNILAGTEPDSIIPIINRIAEGSIKKGSIPPLWDGKSAQRITNIIAKI